MGALQSLSSSMTELGSLHVRAGESAKTYKKNVYTAMAAIKVDTDVATAISTLENDQPTGSAPFVDATSIVAKLGESCCGCSGCVTKTITDLANKINSILLGDWVAVQTLHADTINYLKAFERVRAWKVATYAQAGSPTLPVLDIAKLSTNGTWKSQNADIILLGSASAVTNPAEADVRGQMNKDFIPYTPTFLTLTNDLITTSAQVALLLN